MRKLHRRGHETIGAFRPRVEPIVLRWARESAMLTRAESARLIDVSDSTLAAWEAGPTGPTVAQIRHLAAVYEQPIAAFLLGVPPAEELTPVVRRALSAAGLDTPSRSLVIGLRRAVHQQGIARNLASLLDEQPGPIELRLRPSMDPEQAGIKVREWLGISMTRQRAWRNVDEAFRQWVAAIEAKCLLVLQVRQVGLEEMRAFAVRSDPFPVIGLNERATTVAKTFSLIHELVHVLLVSGSEPPLQIERPRAESVGDDDTTSMFCDRVAASVLMPLEDLMDHGDVAFASASSAWTEEQIRRLSACYRVSGETLMTRLVMLGKANAVTDQSAWGYHADIEDHGRAARTNGQSTGRNGGQMLVHELGRLFVSLVLAALDEDRISSRDATHYLGVPLDQLPGLARIVGHAE